VTATAAALGCAVDGSVACGAAVGSAINKPKKQTMQNAFKIALIFILPSYSLA